MCFLVSCSFVLRMISHRVWNVNAMSGLCGVGCAITSYSFPDYPLYCCAVNRIDCNILFGGGSSGPTFVGTLIHGCSLDSSL